MKKLVSVFLSMIVLLSMIVFPAVSENGSSQNVGTTAEVIPTETYPGVNDSSSAQSGEEGTFPASAVVSVAIGDGDTVGILSGKTSLGTWEYDEVSESKLYTSSVTGTEISALYMFSPKPEERLYSTVEGMKSSVESAISEVSGNLANHTSYLMEIDGYPVALGTGIKTNEGEKLAFGIIAACSGRHLIFILISSPPAVYTPTIEDLRQLAGYFSLDTSQPLITEAQVGLTLSTEDGVTSVSAGQKLKFIASFADPSIVNAQAKNNRINWNVLDSFSPETEIGYYSKDAMDAKIDNRGVLTVSGNIDDVKTVYVAAQSETYGTYAVKKITLLPRVKAVNVEPSAVTLFAAEGQTADISVSLEPASVPLEGLVWTASAKSIVEIEDHGDGSAVIRPLKAGKVSITVKERGGRAGRVNVTVKQPVETLELTARGKAVPGRTLAMNAAISPRNASDKKLAWALDVDESIASISQNGQIRIKKDAPVGQKITVTCTAQGAPEPVVASAEIEITEK